MVRKMDGDLIRWTQSLFSEYTVETVKDGNGMERHPVEAGVTKRAPEPPFLFAI